MPAAVIERGNYRSREAVAMRSIVKDHIVDYMNAPSPKFKSKIIDQVILPDIYRHQLVIVDKEGNTLGKDKVREKVAHCVRDTIRQIKKTNKKTSSKPIEFPYFNGSASESRPSMSTFHEPENMIPTPDVLMPMSPPVMTENEALDLLEELILESSADIAFPAMSEDCDENEVLDAIIAPLTINPNNVDALTSIFQESPYAFERLFDVLSLDNLEAL